MAGPQDEAARQLRRGSQGRARRRPDLAVAGIRPLPQPREDAAARPHLRRECEPLLRGRRAAPAARPVREGRAFLQRLRDAPRQRAQGPQRLHRGVAAAPLQVDAGRRQRGRRTHLQAPVRAARRRARCERRVPRQHGDGARRGRVVDAAQQGRARGGLGPHLPSDRHRPHVRGGDEARGPRSRGASVRHRALRGVQGRGRAAQRASQEPREDRGARAHRDRRPALRLDDVDGRLGHGARHGRRRRLRRRQRRGSNAQGLRRPRPGRRALPGASQGAADARAVREAPARPRRSGWPRQLRPELVPRPHARGAAQGVHGRGRQEQERPDR